MESSDSEQDFHGFGSDVVLPMRLVLEVAGVGEDEYKREERSSLGIDQGDRVGF